MAVSQKSAKYLMKISSLAGIVTALWMTVQFPSSADSLESFVQAPGPLGPLKGTMLTAGQSSPIVLMVLGSVPTDRDGGESRKTVLIRPVGRQIAISQV